MYKRFWRSVGFLFRLFIFFFTRQRENDGLRTLKSENEQIEDVTRCLSDPR